MAEELDVIFTGYSRNDPMEVAKEMKSELNKKGHRVAIVDSFETERDSPVFRKTLLTWSSSKNMISTANKVLVRAGLMGKKVGTMYCYSYGAIPGMFQNTVFANRYVFLAPALGKGTIKWSFKENVFSFLPGLREMNDEVFQEKIFERLSFLQENGKDLCFFFPQNVQTNLYEDERVWYPLSMLREHENIFSQKYFVPVNLHRDMIKNPEIVKRILENLGI